MSRRQVTQSDSFRHELETLLEGRERVHPAELFRDVTDEFWLWINTEGRESSPALWDLVPGLPDAEHQRRWTGKVGFAALAEGFAIYRAMRDLHAAHFGGLHDRGPILDFGCGWGRVIRYFVKDVAPGQLIGSDLDETLVDYCVASNPWCRFHRNETGPPLAMADNEVGFIYAYSVFSHLPEAMHSRWLAEFKRVLRPGGALALSVRPRGFIEHCHRLRTGEVQGVSMINRHMFLDTEAALARYDNGEFCFSPYDPSDEGRPWGEACIPREYIEQHWSKEFDILEFVPADELKQHVVLLKA